MKLVGSMEEAREAKLSPHRKQLKFWRDISAARGCPLKSVGSNPQAGLPSIEHQSQTGTQITSSCEKYQGFCPPGRDGWRCREPVKGPMNKISFATTYPGLHQREGRVRIVWAGGSGQRTEGIATRTPLLSHSTY